MTPALKTAVSAGVLALCVATSSLAQVRRPVPVRNPDIPIQLPGLTVLPPKGESWFFVDRSPSAVMFGKPPPSPTHTVFALAAITALKERLDPANFIAQVRSRLAGETGSERYENTSFETAADAQWPEHCVTYRLDTIDKGSAQAPGARLRMVGVGRMCLHPGTLMHIVDMRVSERGNDAGWTPAFAQEGQQFLASLRFIDMTAKDVELIRAPE